MFQAVISIFQLLTITVDAIEDPRISYRSINKKVRVRANETKYSSLMNLLFVTPQHETIFKAQIDKSLREKLCKHKRNYSSTNLMNRKYDLIGEFLDMHLNGVAIILKLQQLGSENSKTFIDCKKVANAAYYPYVLRMLIEWNVVPLIKDKKSMSFDTLHAYITNLISRIGTSEEQKILLSFINDPLDMAIKLIKKYWEEKFLRLKPINPEKIKKICKVSEIISNIQSNLEIVLNNMYDADVMKIEEFLEIKNFISMVAMIPLFLSSYVTGIVNMHLSLRCNENEASVKASTTGLTLIEKYFDEVSSFVKILLWYSINPSVIDTFLTEIKSECNVMATEDMSIRTGSSIRMNSESTLLEMLLATQPLRTAFTTIRMGGDKKTGFWLDVEEDEQGISVLNILETDRCPKDTPKKDISKKESTGVPTIPAVSQSRRCSTRAKLLISGGFGILIGCIAGFIYSKRL